MQPVHSHFHDYPNPTPLYFDPEQEFSMVREERGCSDRFLVTLRVFGKVINQAYEDGFKDGQKEGGTKHKQRTNDRINR